MASKYEDQKDKLSAAHSCMHQKEIEIDGLRSSFSNKAAEAEELMTQLSKQVCYLIRDFCVNGLHPLPQLLTNLPQPFSPIRK